MLEFEMFFLICVSFLFIRFGAGGGGGAEGGEGVG